MKNPTEDSYTFRLFEGSRTQGSGFLSPRVPLDEFNVTTAAQPAVPVESKKLGFRNFKDVQFVAPKPLYCDGALLVDEDDMVVAVMARSRQFLKEGDSMTIDELWITEEAFA